MQNQITLEEAVKRGIARYLRRRRRRRPHHYIHHRKRLSSILHKTKKKSTGPTIWRSELMQHIADRMI